MVWCLSPDRLARSYAYQVLILDELARFGVTVAFTDAPGLDQDDPQARLLTQVQGVIAEYERAKIGERYRRGKLFRARAGEVISWKAPYGYRRIPRGPDGPAHLEIFEPEAAVVRRIFAERAAGTTIRQICRQLNADAVPTPTGSRAVWGTSTLDRLLRNEAYIGRVYFNRTEAVPDRRPGHHSRQVPRPRDDWIAISCPAIIADETFEAAGKASTDNAKWSPRRAEPGAWLLRGLVKCGPCGVGTSCHKMRGRNGTWHRYYYCHNHDPLRAGGQDRRCPERNIRADALDDFVFDQIRAALLDPALLLAGEQAITLHAPVPDDQLLAAELARLDRKLEAARGEHRRLIDLYQAGLIDMPELQRRAAAITARQRELEHKRASLAAERADLARGNRLRHGVEDFAARVTAVIDQLDPAQQQELLRLLIEDVQVTGWHIQIRLRIPLDDPPDDASTRPRTATQPGQLQPPRRPCQPKTVCVPFMFMDGPSYRPNKRPGARAPPRGRRPSCKTRHRPGPGELPEHTPGELRDCRGRRRAAVDTEDPRLRRRAPGDKYGPDRCRDDAAHREGEVARRRARGRFRSGGDAESRKASQDQQDARRHADGSQARAGRDLTAAHQQQGRGHYPPVGSRVTSQHAHRLPHRAIRGRLKRAGNQPAPDQDNRRQQGCAYRPARDWPASPQKPRAIGWQWFSSGRSRARAYVISS